MIPHRARPGRLGRAALLHCVLLSLTLSASPAAARQRPAPAPANAAAQAVARRLRAEDIFPLATPLATFEVGGIVIPGKERLGTYFNEESLKLLGEPKLHRGTSKLETPLDLGTFEELRARVPALAAARISADNRCLQSPLVAEKLSETGFDPFGGEAASARPFRESLATELAGRVDLTNEELQSFVIVTSTIAPLVEVKDCADDKHRDEIRDAVAALVWGYRGATPNSHASSVGSGWGDPGRPTFGLTPRMPFEWVALGLDDRVWLQPVTTDPEGASVGFVDEALVILSGQRAASLSDPTFTWPDTPAAFYIPPGKYYFRLKDGRGRTSTMPKRITVDSRQLELKFSEGEVK